MLYMVTFTINIPQMLAYIPYMDPMGIVLNNGPQPDLLAPSPSPFGGVDKTALGWFLTGGATHWTAGGLQVREQRVRFGDFSTVDCLVN